MAWREVAMGGFSAYKAASICLSSALLKSPDIPPVEAGVALRLIFLRHRFLVESLVVRVFQLSLARSVLSLKIKYVHSRDLRVLSPDRCRSAELGVDEE